METDTIMALGLCLSNLLGIWALYRGKTGAR